MFIAFTASRNHLSIPLCLSSTSLCSATFRACPDEGRMAQPKLQLRPFCNS